MVARKAIGILGAAHVSGNGLGHLLSPGGQGADATNNWLPTGQTWGTCGWVRIAVGAEVNGPFAVNQIITGGTSGAKARVIEVTVGEMIVERLSFFPPVIGLQAGFAPTETITADNSPATSATLLYAIEQSSWRADGVGSTMITFDQQTDTLLASKTINQILPTDAGANIWWDRGAQLARSLAVASGTALSNRFTATNGIGRIEGVTSGAKGLLVRVSGDTSSLANISGTFTSGELLKSAGETPGTFDTVDGNITLGTERITETTHGLVNGNVLRVTQSGPGFPTSTPQIAINTNYFVVGVTAGTPDDFQISTTVGGTPINFTSASTTATLTWTKYITTATGTLGTAQTIGEWVPYSARPNLIGIGRGWEFPPAGGDVCYRAGGVGIEPKLMSAAHARWGDDLAAIKLDVNGPNTGNASGYGGVTYGMIPCSAVPALTFAHIGATVTAAGGFTATLAAFNIASKLLWVKNTSGTVLAAGTVTIGSGGGTATATGNVKGWMKGASHYQQFLTEITNATAKLGSDTLDWQMVFLDSVEGDIGTMPPLDFATSQGSYDVDIIAAWRAFYTAISAQLANPDLVVVALGHRTDYRGTSNANASGYHQIAIRSAATGFPNLRLVVADDENFPAAVQLPGHIVTPTEVIYLETFAYQNLGPLIWETFLTASLSQTTTDLSQAAVVLITGQSQTVARIPYAWWQLEEDPELAKLSTLGTNNVNTLDENIQIYNAITGQWEVYSVLANAVTFGDQIANYSSLETSLLSRLKGRYGRIYCIKVGFNGSSMDPTVAPKYATWGEVTRTTASGTFAVTIPSAGRGRFTAAGGAAPFTPAVWAAGTFVEISGNDGGTGTYVNLGGNNTIPAPTAVALQIAAVDPSGTWIEFLGTFAADAASSTVFTQGPIDLRTQAGAVIRDALTRWVTEELKVPRHVATITWQGEADCIAAPTAYLTHALGHIDWCRSVFGHKIGGEPDCPHVWLKVTRSTSFDPNEDRTNVDLVRAAQDQLAIDRENVVVVETSDLPLKLEAGTWPRTSYADYGGHHTPRAVIIAGYRADAALNAFSWITAHPSGPALSDYGYASSPYGDGGDSESADAVAPATFIVEDGTGVASANSYCTTAFADDYFANMGAPASWTGSTTAQKEEALRIGTAWVDRKYAARFKGVISDYEQSLEWPRGSVVDESGRWFESNEIPTKLKRAVCEIALRHRDGVDLWPDVDGEELGVASESTRVGEIDVSTTYHGTRATLPSFTAAEQMLRGLLINGGSRLTVRVYR